MYTCTEYWCIPVQSIGVYLYRVLVYIYLYRVLVYTRSFYLNVRSSRRKQHPRQKPTRPRMSSDAPRPPLSRKKKSSSSATPFSDEDDPKRRLKSATRRRSSGNDSSSGVGAVANGYGGFSSGAESGGENNGREYISEL